MKFIVFVFALIIAVQLKAQNTSKKIVSIDDFADWNTILNPQISNNGKYVAFELNPQKGNGNLIIKHGNHSDTIPRGYKLKFGSENNVAVFQIKQPVDTIRKAKEDKLKKEKMPKDSLGIFCFKEKRIRKYPKVKSFKVSEENLKWIPFVLEPSDEQDTSKTKNKNKKQPGDDLVLFQIKTTDTIQFKNVTEYSISKGGEAIFFIQQTKDTANTYSSIKRFDIETENVNEVFASQGWSKSLISSEDAENFAFIHSNDTTDEKAYSLYYGTIKIEPQLIIDEKTKGLPVGWAPSENGKIYFSKDGLKLYFGTANVPEPEPEDSLLAEEKPKLDVWNWKDSKLQPQQKIELEKEKKRTYLAVYNTSAKEFVQLADLKIKNVTTIEKGNGNIGLGYDVSPYQRESSWTGKRNRDYYLIDFETGIKRKILKDKSYVRISPQGKYVVWYETADSSYYARSTSIDNLDIVPLTNILPVNFYNERHDTPNDPRPYGIAGFSPDDRFVYIYDRYDIWRLDPSGEKVAVCMTRSFGRKNLTRLRYEKLDKELEYIPTNETILLNAIDERTMSRGYFSARLNTIKEPDLLVMDKFMFGKPIKARNAEKIIWTKQNVSTFPDLWCSNLKFEHIKRISNANPQQEEYIWPEVKLVEWISFAGETLKGMLYTPENLDISKKYPMIVYFYERSSEGLHYHTHPKPSHSTINRTFYTSNGYIVFVPDITYKTGYPGQSAYDAIVSGTQFIRNSYSFVNKYKIGLQGQSWGGYQTAWLITQTDLYAAAMAGAPVSNMTSAYGGIRWQTGMSRMFQYEHTQSRIGGTLWEKPLLYIENSPVFHAPKITTPLLMMHNDNDGAVPWYQGIEMFVALRRLDKPVWMLTYNGEPHNLPVKSWANRVDLSHRMFQFFNHYLKDKSAPEWMDRGVPAIDKGKNLGY